MAKKNTEKQYARALYELTLGLRGEKIKEAVHGFAALLARRHKLRRLEKIISEFERYAKNKEGIVEVEINSARELDSRMLKKICSAFGEQVESRVKVEPELLGGIKIKTAETILDASFKKQLLIFKQHLLTNKK